MRLIHKCSVGVVLGVACAVAMAHEVSDGLPGGFVTGFSHPLTGWDHALAMVAVGLWGAFLGAPALWLLPVIFPLVMALGGVLGIFQVPLPGIEIGIAVSAIVIGLMVALKVRPALWVAGLIVGIFAIFHGHAHGTEFPSTGNPLVDGLGFMLATGLLHLFGIAIGTALRWPAGVWLVRTLGGLIAVSGVAFLVAAL